MAERRITADGRILEKGADGVVRVVGTAGGQRGMVVPASPIKTMEAPRLEGQMRNTDANTANTQVQTQRTAQQIELDRRRQALEEQKFQTSNRQVSASRQKEIEARKSLAKDLVYDIFTLDRLENDLSDSWFSPGFGEVGAVGNFMKDIPGTAAKDVANQITGLKSNIARSALTRMRQESPTGGAVGNPSDRDITMLEYSRGPIDQSDSYDTFIRNLREVRARTFSELKRIAPNFAPRLESNVYKKRSKGGGTSRQSPQTGPAFLGFED